MLHKVLDKISIYKNNQTIGVTFVTLCSTIQFQKNRINLFYFYYFV